MNIITLPNNTLFCCPKCGKTIQPDTDSINGRVLQIRNLIEFKCKCGVPLFYLEATTEPLKVEFIKLSEFDLVDKETIEPVADWLKHSDV